MNNINMMCPINFTGYGIVSYNIYKSLRKKLDICLFPIGNVQIDEEEYQNCLVEDMEKQKDFQNSSTFFKIWHHFDLHTRIGNQKYGALTFFEIDKLTKNEVRAINNLDCIFVASNWAKNVLIDNGVNTQIVITPIGVNQELFNNDVNKLVKKDDEKYVFINIGKWEIRKGHDVLIEAFNQAFQDEDKVELWMLNHNPFLNSQEHSVWVNLYKNSKLGHKIKIIPRLNAHKDVAKLIALSDCGVFPSRAEGWNNEIPECFAINKPVIATNYSAHTEYCNQNNCFLIDIDNLTEANDGKFFKGFGKWADFDEIKIDELAEKMRYVYKNNIRTNPGGLETVKNLTWSNTTDIIYNTLF